MPIRCAIKSIGESDMTIRPAHKINTVLAALSGAAMLSGCVAASSQASDRKEEARAGEAAQSSRAAAHDSTGEETELSLEQAIARLKEQGYSDVTEIEREGDRYCAEARNPSGEKVEVYVDAATGEIVKKHNGGLSKEKVIERLKEQGYPEVSEIEREGDRYWVMARDAEGRRFELHVSAKTGEILRQERENE